MTNNAYGAFNFHVNFVDLYQFLEVIGIQKIFKFFIVALLSVSGLSVYSFHLCLRLKGTNCYCLHFVFAVCHAEMNAIVKKTAADVKGCTMYVTHFPCNECAKVIIQAGLSEVVYRFEKNPEKDEAKASSRMLDMAGVKVR